MQPSRFEKAAFFIFRHTAQSRVLRFVRYFLNINIVEVSVNAFEEIDLQNDYDKDKGELCPVCACANCVRNAFGAQP